MSRTARYWTPWLLATALLFAPGAVQAQSPCGAFYTVTGTETLGAIAARCGTTVPALLAINPGLRSTAALEVGGSIRMPDPDAALPTPVEACGPFYIVRHIDTLAEVAGQCGLTVPLLLAVNPGLGTPDRLSHGDRIRIPDLPPAIGVATAAGIFVADPAEEEPVRAAPDLETVRVEGVLESGGACARLRTDEGRVVNVTGRHGFGPGDRIVLVGLPVDAGCDGETLAARIVWSPS